MAGLHTAIQRLPEDYTAVRRVGEVPRVPDLAADNPEDFTAAKRPDLVALWDNNVTRGSALPTDAGHRMQKGTISQDTGLDLRPLNN